MFHHKAKKDPRIEAVIAFAHMFSDKLPFQVLTGGVYVKDERGYERLPYGGEESPKNLYLGFEFPNTLVHKTEEIVEKFRSGLPNLKKKMGLRKDFDIQDVNNGKFFISLEPILEKPELIKDHIKMLSRRNFLIGTTGAVIDTAMLGDGIRRLRDKDGKTGQKVAGSIETAIGGYGVLMRLKRRAALGIVAFAKNKHPDFMINDSEEHWSNFETNVYRQFGSEKPKKVSSPQAAL